MHADIICSDNFHSSVKHRLRFIPMIKESFVRTGSPPLPPRRINEKSNIAIDTKINICFKNFSPKFLIREEGR